MAIRLPRRQFIKQGALYVPLFNIFVPKLKAQLNVSSPFFTAGVLKPAAGGGGGSNVTYDTSAASACGVGVATRTINITVGNNTNRVLIVMAGAGDSVLADRTVDSVSSDVDGAFTHVTSSDADDGAYCRMEGWRLIAPTVGAHVITITYSGGATQAAVAGAISLYGVDQTTPIGTPTVVNGTVSSTTPNGAVTLGSDDMAVGGLMTDSTTLSWTTGTSRQVVANCDTDVSYGMASNTGTGSISVQASTGDFLYALVVLPVNGAS